MIKQISQANVEAKIITFKGNNVILDSDVAKLYGVETKRVNEAVKNNPTKFPEGYLIELSQKEWAQLKSNFSTSIKGGKTKPPKAFTERGLYMLATILKSNQATQTTIAIIETFYKVKEITKSVHQLHTTKENTPNHQAIMQKTGELISDLIAPEKLDTSESESSVELNLAIVKFKYRVKKKPKITRDC
ncbi:MAG: ORF6N domain-containing protein [Coxiellaceae bacterium]|nr:ORF6N domain-containing protein [Coxiellaceae bacterium]